MDVFKEAFSLSIKNLEIKENDQDQDGQSVSEMSLSQAT